MENLYQILGVEASASPAEIKKAYGKKLRESPVEQYPEEFQNIRRAYEILSDESQRSQYDRTIRNNGNYGKMLNQSLELIDKEQYSAAVTILQEMLKDYPNDREIRYQLCLCYFKSDKVWSAKSILTALIQEDPGNVEYLTSMANIHTNQKEYEPAIDCYKRLIQLEPQESDHYLRLSYCYTAENQYASAVDVLEQKLSKQTKETIFDYPLLSELYFLTLIMDQENYRATIINRMQQLPTNVEEKEQLLVMLMDSCESIENTYALKEHIQLIKNINRHEFTEVDEWIKQAEEYLISASQTEAAAAYAPQAPLIHESAPVQVRGSILIAIIIGIIGSFVMTPFGGIIAGFIYYFYAESIIKILKVIGCLGAIILFIIIIFALK